MEDKKKNVFISHFGEHDEHVGKLKTLLADKGYILRNSSIDSTKPNDASNTDYIKSLLRDGIKWAGTTIVLIGPKTSTRWWVDYEIEQSNKMGNRIVGVHLQGETESEVPDSFDKHGDALVGWNGDRIIDAIEGRINNFQNPDGSPQASKWQPDKGEC